jgi:uncharacterized delta-60 repeat protein
LTLGPSGERLAFQAVAEPADEPGSRIFGSREAPMRRKLLSHLTPQPSRVVVVAVIVGLVFSAVAIAAAGDLDTSFSADGKQMTDFGFGADDGASGVVLQGDGKIVAVGTADGGATGSDFALARYNPNGSLDPSFSGDGRKRLSFGGDERVFGEALHVNGKIVAVGRAGPTGDDFAIARFNPNGSLDPSFSGDGKQTTHFAGGDGALGVAIQADGKAVVVGSQCANDCAFAVARYNPNGSLDPSFSGDGKQTTEFGEAPFRASGVALQGSKIVAVGSGGSDFAIARYNPNGSLDASFSGDGRQTTNFGAIDFATQVALQSGKIVAVGGTATPNGSGFALARYNSNGTLDTSFSGDGKQMTGFGDYVQGMVVAPDGKLVVVGAEGPLVTDFAIARYNPNGSLDPSFSGDGKQTTDVGDGGEATGVALQSDGKIVAVGTGRGPALGDDFALVRYLGG